MSDKDQVKFFLCIAISILFYGIFKPESYVMLPAVIIGSMSLCMASMLIINNTWKNHRFTSDGN